MPTKTSSARVAFATADDDAAQAFERAAKAAGVECRRLRTGEEALAQKGGVVALDDRLPGRNAYELCFAIRRESGPRILVAHRPEDGNASALARFCGAEGTLPIPTDEEALRAALERPGAPPEGRALRRAGEGSPGPAFHETMLREIAAPAAADPESLVRSLCDPETKLFNARFLLFKLDEEFKRAQRFRHPLACVFLGFEGEASADTLLELAGAFLVESRDTDVLGRFDLNSFVFLLPFTGTDGARRMVGRMVEAAGGRGIRDLAGDPVALSAGIALAPNPEFARGEDLLEAARKAFLRARDGAGGVATAG